MNFPAITARWPQPGPVDGEVDRWVVVRLGGAVVGVGFVGGVETGEPCTLGVSVAGVEVDVGAAGWKLGVGAVCCPQAASARPNEAASNV